MLRLPPRPTRPDTRFPYTTRFRSKKTRRVFGGMASTAASYNRSKSAASRFHSCAAGVAPSRSSRSGKKVARADFWRRARSIRSEEHTSELQSLMRNSYADFLLQKKKNSDNQKDERLTDTHII